MNIALPESLEALVRRRVLEKGYASAEEYIGALILADETPAVRWEELSGQQRQEVKRINDLLERALDSGPPVVADEAYWEVKKKRIRENGLLDA
jgi:hypothetical protein